MAIFYKNSKGLLFLLKNGKFAMIMSFINGRERSKCHLFGWNRLCGLATEALAPGSKII